jgi:branched-chain amino acid transport system substrate-binding protein
VVDPNGEVIYAGKEEFAKALQLIKDGKPVKYEGVIGPVSFDQYGDITGPFRLWRIQNGEVATVSEMTTADVDAIKAKLGN